MKPFVVVLAIVLLAALVAGQEVSRRERLRGLISAARSGDVEARKALRSLRDKLRRRTGQAEQAATQPEPEVQQEQQTANFVEPIAETPVEILPESEPVQIQPISRQPQRDRGRILLDPHRALNRGLEVDTRSEANAVIKVTNQTKTPPIATIKRYSYFDDQGNYVFGYEAADGSFKEEKRGLDCIVHGKYGYVDPDGVRREYTYVSGNKCDPNAPTQEGPQVERVLNNQFLEEKISGEPFPQRTSESLPTHTRSQINRRRRPIKAQQPQQEFVNIPKAIPEKMNVVQPEPVEILPEVVPQVEQVQPVEPISEIPVVVTQRTTIPHFQIKTESIVPIFRPTPKPINFDFDSEFKNIFSHFGISRPRAQVHLTPTKAPVRSPPPPSPPPPQQKVTERPVTAKPAPVKTEQTPANIPHQLVFDSATGTFKTVPFQNLNLAVIPVPFPKTSAAKTSTGGDPTTAGKPLPLTGFNPLPSIPLGALSFKGASVASAAQFDNFFNQFRISQ